MQAQQLPNLRGYIGNANRLKIEVVKAVNQVSVYAKRGSGTAPSAQALTDLLQVAIDELAQYIPAP